MVEGRLRHIASYGLPRILYYEIITLKGQFSKSSATQGTSVLFTEGTLGLACCSVHRMPP
jgi:hypothetical protein